MSYPSQDRHERDVPSVQTRNPSQEMEKHEKSKLMGGTAGVSIAMQDSGAFHRQQIEHAALKAGKPLQNRPIAPASGSIGGILPGHLVPGGLPGFGGAPVPGHPMIASAPIPLASMIRVAQPAFSHVPAGAAAGALAGVTPRSTTALRTPAVPPVKPPGHMTQSHSAHGQSQLHAPATTTGSSLPSSPSPVTTPLATVAVTTSLHQQVSEHKQSDVREARPGIVPEITRRGGSPHCSSPVVQSTGPSHPSASTGSKIIPVASSTLSQAHPGQKPTLSMLPSHLHSSSVHSGMPATVTGPSINSSMSLIPTVAHAMAAHTQQPKIPPNTVSVIPATMAAQGKVYTHPHHLAFTAPRQATIPSSDASMNASEHSRLSKPNGSASPAAVSTLHTSTVSAVSHLGAASLNSVAGGENRLERTHQALPVPSQFPYHHGMAAGFLYPDALSVHPHAASLHAQYHQPAYGPLSSLARTQQGVATSAAAAAAQVVVAAATGMNPMHIVDPSRILFQQAALGVGASGIGNLGGVDTPVTGGVMDISGAPAGIYSVPHITAPPSASIHAQLSAQNPNATSPRPSILRKRTIEGIRKPTTQLTYNEVLSSNQTEAASSPRSDSTLSASHSTQNSPKPPSDAGSQQPTEPVVTTASFTTADVQPVSHNVPASPVKIKSEPSSEAPVSTVINTTMVNDSASLPARVVSKVLMASSEAASPRKKPRKQNVVPTEDKYGSNVSMGPDSPTNEEVKAKQDEDEDLKFILLKRPKISIVGGYKINTKAAHNHFQRYSDVKVKEEKKPSIQEIASQKGIVQRANGWRIQHIAGQMDELVSAEQDVLKKMGEFRDRIPKVKPGQKTKFQDELAMLNELLQGNIQRSQLVVEQLGDSRKSMVKVLEHRPKVIDIIQKQMNKRNPKKKN